MDVVTLGFRQVIIGWERWRDVICAELGIGVPDLQTLGFLNLDGPLTASEIATRLRLTSGSVTALLDRLERAGLAKRQQNPADRRSVVVVMTEAGDRAIQSVFERLNRSVLDLLERYPNLDREMIAEFLTAAGTEWTRLAAQGPQRPA